MAILRGMAILFLVLGGAMLALGLGGFADEWLETNVSCGDEYNSHPCAPGEAQGVLALVGGIFVAVALIELVVSIWWARMARSVTGDIAAAVNSGWTNAATMQPSAVAAWGGAPAPMPAAGGDGLADRLARLSDLRDRGVLTESEFQAQKSKLL